MSALVMLLSCHFVGDFVFQSDRMATGKSKSFMVLAQHVTAYLVPFVVALAFWHGEMLAYRAGLFVVATAGLHFAQDAITSRITSKLWFFEPYFDAYSGDGKFRIKASGNRHWFFVMIGFDQLLHVYALAGAWALCS